MLTSTQWTNHRQRVPIDIGNLEEALDREWLLSNERGSYASGTILGCNTRRYHGLLVASLHPPVERIVTVSNLLETVWVGPREYELANFEFSDRLHPQGYRYLKEFWQDTGVHFVYELEGMQVEKSIYLSHEHDFVIVSYDFSGGAEAIRFQIKPLVALRDFHSLQSSSAPMHMEQQGDVVTAYGLDPQGPAVHLRCEGATFHRVSDWWYAMRYRQETRRGQHDYEDVWALGLFETTVQGPQRVTLVVHATAGLQRPGPLDFDVEELVNSLRQRNQRLFAQAGTQDELEEVLVKAADQFIVRRQIDSTRYSASILAGYHWFADWGRDTFIALPGLLLSTGRTAEAREVLETFSGAADQGMIPNRFDDYGGEPHYNGVDASLWFIQAAYRYFEVTGDAQTYYGCLRGVMGRIVAAYQQGTRFGIHADGDGLISAGDAQTQLTWMDARCNGVSFTPRFGKAVEINALWINALRIMAATAKDAAEQRHYESLAATASVSFGTLFWNGQRGCLYDCVFPDGSKDGAIRPNQIFAVSLPFSCLDRQQQGAVVQVVQEELLTPYGLRSLSPGHGQYQGHYSGDQFQRDSAYHQGTVWGYLIGPFVEGYLKVHEYSDTAKAQGREFIEPLLERHLNGEGCLGSVSEIFDGDWPHKAKGCIAQAWSVAELLRIKQLLK